MVPEFEFHFYAPSPCSRRWQASICFHLHERELINLPLFRKDKDAEMEGEKRGEKGAQTKFRENGEKNEGIASG